MLDVLDGNLSKIKQGRDSSCRTLWDSVSKGLQRWQETEDQEQTHEFGNTEVTGDLDKNYCDKMMGVKAWFKQIQEKMSKLISKEYNPKLKFSPLGLEKWMNWF